MGSTSHLIPLNPLYSTKLLLLLIDHYVLAQSTLPTLVRCEIPFHVIYLTILLTRLRVMFLIT